MLRFTFLLIWIVILLSACDEDSDLRKENLSNYIQLNSDRNIDELIACAAGRPEGFPDTSDDPTSIFFYPIDGATDFRYYEAEHLSDSADYTKYEQLILVDEPVFNGYLRKFNRPDDDDEKMGIVTYLTEGTLHISDPIRLKSNSKPTELNNDLLIVTGNPANPTFNWSDGAIDENVIYFQVISETEGDLISGTYTFEKTFTFYDLSNVVLNVSPPDVQTTLENDIDYSFTMMAVSEDNWVNLLITLDL